MLYAKVSPLCLALLLASPLGTLSTARDGECPARHQSPTATPTLHIFTASYDPHTGQSTGPPLVMMSACGPTSVNENSSCVIKNIAERDINLNTGTGGGSFTASSKVMWWWAALKNLPDDDLVIFLDGTDIVYGGCGNTHPGGLAHVARARLLTLLRRANASVVLGAELNAYDMTVKLATPQWAHARCPHLSSADGSAEWIFQHTDCTRTTRSPSDGHRRLGRPWRPSPCIPGGKEGGLPSMSNVNSGFVGGFVCELRAATKVISEAPASLRGCCDQGKFMSWFMDEQSKVPAAAGKPGDVTLDYCSDLVLNVFRGPEMPLTFDATDRTISLGGRLGLDSDSNGKLEKEPLCFLHFNGLAYSYKSFETTSMFSGVHCPAASKNGKCSFV